MIRPHFSKSTDEWGEGGRVKEGGWREEGGIEKDGGRMESGRKKVSALKVRWG